MRDEIDRTVELSQIGITEASRTAEPEHSTRAGRRRFAKIIMAALAAAPFAFSLSRAQTPPAKESPAPPNPQPSPTPSTPQAPSPVAEAYAAVARARFGDQLTTEELGRVRRDLEGNVRSAERLRAVKLKNADEPDFIFNA